MTVVQRFDFMLFLSVKWLFADSECSQNLWF